MAIFLFGFGAPSSFRLRFLPESAILKALRVDKVPRLWIFKNWRSVRELFSGLSRRSLAHNVVRLQTPLNHFPVHIGKSICFATWKSS